MVQHAPAEQAVSTGEVKFATIPEAIEEFKAGRFVLIVDDEDRENEGDLVIAAEFCTAAQVNFMAREGCGLICMPMLGRRLDELRIPMMVLRPPQAHSTAFTVSVDARDGISLTVTETGPGRFGVMLVEYTQGAVTLARKPVGAAVNLEVDVLAKYVERLMEARLGATSTR